MDSREWFHISAAGGGTAEIYIYGRIGVCDQNEKAASAQELARQLSALGREINCIKVYINSVGGNAWESLAVNKVLRRHSAWVVVVIDVVAASGASVVAMAGDTVIMPEGSRMMIHNPTVVPFEGVKAMRRALRYWEKTRKAMISAYLQKAKQQDEISISRMMEKGTWMTSAEAVQKGFANTSGIILPKAFDLSHFRRRALISNSKDKASQRKVFHRGISKGSEYPLDW